MEPRFEVQSVYTKEYIRKLYHTFSIRPKYRRTRLINFISAIFCLCVTAPLFNPLIIQPLLRGAFMEQLSDHPLVVLYLLAAPFMIAYLLIISIFADRVDAHRRWKEQKKYEGTITSTQFFDDHFCDLSSSSITTSLSYGEVIAIEESKDFFIMIYPGSRAVSVSKSDFTVGTPDDFRVFLTEKTGKKIKFIR